MTATLHSNMNGTGATSTGEHLPDRFDVAVVGGGLAGLAGAALAARDGRSVVLFEQASEVGGRARTRTDHGFNLNLGPHALFRDGIALKVLRDLGVEPQVALLDQSGSYLVKAGRLYGL